MGPGPRVTLRHKLPLFVLSLSALSFVPNAKAACAVSGVPVFSGSFLDTNGAFFYTEAGGSGSVSIQFTASSGCTYFVTSDSSWLTTSQSSSVQNQGTSVTVTFSLAPNSTSIGWRTGNLTVYVNKTAVSSAAVDENSSTCTTKITSQNPASFPASGGSGSYSFTTGGCLYDGWSASAGWVTLGSYSATSISYTIAPNTGPARSATMSFSDPPGQSFTVNQAAGSSGSLTLNCNPSSGPTTVGQSYISNCTGAGGVPPYTWSLATGQLPPGIGWTSSGATARISGTPTAAGPYLYGPKLTDSAGTFATQTFTGSVSGGNASGSLTLSCVPTTGPTAAGTAYTATCTASGGTTPYTFSISTGLGSLPAGLGFSSTANTGTVSGTPTGAGALGYSYVVMVVDNASASATQSYSGALIPAALTITSLFPSSATAGGAAFTLTVNGTGFSSGAAVNWAGAALATTYIGPTQLSALVPSSLIAPAGTAAITVTSGNVTTGATKFTINSNLLTMSCSPAAGPTTEGVSYLATCSASGGAAPYTWSISAGALPKGLAPSGTTGSSITISGTPQVAGPYSYSVKVTDVSSTPQSQSQSFSGTLAQPAAAITALTCNGTNGPSTVGVRYADTCTAPNGVAPFSWSISAGTLPAGLTLNGAASGTATISGTPTTAGPFNYTLKVSDSTSPAPLAGTQVFTGSIGQAGSPTLTVSPASLSFTYRPDLGVPNAQSLSLFTTGTSTSFTVSVNGSFLSATPSGGQTPGSVAVSVVNVAGLAPGTYSGQVMISASSVNPPSVTVPVALIVQAVPAPQLTLVQTQVAYGLTQGSAAVQSQLLVANSGGGVLSFTTSVTGCSCVSVSTGTGQASASAPAAVAYTVNPAGLPPSTYFSQIVINASDGEQVTVPVTTAVNALTQSMVLTQTGLLFGTVAQGAAPPTQSFSIINAGQGTMNWTVTAQTLSGTPGWLSVSPSSGSVAAGAVSTPVTVSVNPGTLAIGQYYGLVQVTAPNAGNSPQVISVLFNVVDPSQGAVLVSPLGELVGSVAGANLTGVLTVYNLSNQALTYTSTVSTTDGGSWLVVSPASGNVPASGSVQVTVGTNASALPSGTGQGVVRLGFSNGIVQSVGVSSLSVGSSSAPSNNGIHPDAQGGCQLSSLVPTVSSLGPSFTVTQSQPQNLSVSIVDNCHNAAPQASVSVSFSNGDKLSPPLVNQGNGIWTGTWTPKTAGAQVTVSVLALEEQGLTVTSGLLQLTGTVQSAASSDAPAPATALNSASGAGGVQISPGSWVTILGDRLANGVSSASGTFPPALVGTAVMIGSTALPLDYVGPTQVNALLPFSLMPNSTVSLAVQRAGTVSVPLNVTIADVGPAIFSTTGDGTGQGAVVIASSGVLAAPVGAFPGSQPVVRGDFLAIYCTGLGAVNNTPADGAPAPSSAPLATTLATPSVTIGGEPATVSYSGLAPGLVGLYQVNVQVPASVPTGDAVNLAITVGSLTSNTVTVAVR